MRFGGSACNQTTSFSAASLFLASCGSGCSEQPGGYCSLLGPTCRNSGSYGSKNFVSLPKLGLSSAAFRAEVCWLKVEMKMI